MLILIFISAAVAVCLLDGANGQCNYAQYMTVGTNYSVFSPGLEYNRKYTPGTSCSWTGQAPAGYQIVLNCRTFQLPDSPQCVGDRVTVSPSGSSTFNDGQSYCGARPFFVRSYSNTINIALNSYPANAGGYFYCDMYATDSCDCGRRKQSRIVGGTETQINEFPSMCLLGERDSSNRVSMFCGGTIISNRYVITAAHCLARRSAASSVVVVGEHDRNVKTESAYYAEYPVSQFRINGIYNAARQINDIAIVQTASAITYNMGVGPACLPFKFTGATFDNRQLDVVGWGSTEYGGGLSTKLLKASVYGYPFSNCNNAYGNQLISSQLCTYASGRDACQYDSGGPVYFTFDGILYDVGVISFGESCASSKPGVNSRITSFLDWIQSQTPEVNYCIK